MKSTIYLAFLVAGSLHLHGCSFPTAQMYASDPFLEKPSSPQSEAAGRAAIVNSPAPFDPTQEATIAQASDPFLANSANSSRENSSSASMLPESAPPVNVAPPAENPDVQTHIAVAEPPVIQASAVAAKPIRTSQWRPSTQGTTQPK